MGYLSSSLFAYRHWQQSCSRNENVFLGVVSKFEDSLFKSFKSEHNSGTPFFFFSLLWEWYGHSLNQQSWLKGTLKSKPYVCIKRNFLLQRITGAADIRPNVECFKTNLYGSCDFCFLPLSSWFVKGTKQQTLNKLNCTVGWEKK